jgi:hypothetical protein
MRPSATRVCRIVRGNPRRRRTSTTLETAVLTLRDQHPAWGGRKLAPRLQALGQTDIPSPSTITAILRRHNRLNPQESAQHKG